MTQYFMVFHIRSVSGEVIITRNSTLYASRPHAVKEARNVSAELKYGHPDLVPFVVKSKESARGKGKERTGKR